LAISIAPYLLPFLQHWDFDAFDHLLFTLETKTNGFK